MSTSLTWPAIFAKEKNFICTNLFCPFKVTKLKKFHCIKKPRVSMTFIWSANVELHLRIFRNFSLRLKCHLSLSISSANQDDKLTSKRLHNGKTSLETLLLQLKFENLPNRTHWPYHPKFHLSVYDANGQIPTAILSGNVNSAGDYQECLSVNSLHFRGKHCIVELQPFVSESAPYLNHLRKLAQSFDIMKSTFDDVSPH